jgi:hypothetical protein
MALREQRDLAYLAKSYSKLKPYLLHGVFQPAYSGQADQRFGPWRSRVRACRSRSERSDAELF